jgi:hypothetical protein
MDIAIPFTVLGPDQFGACALQFHASAEKTIHRLLWKSIHFYEPTETKSSIVAKARLVGLARRRSRVTFAGLLQMDVHLIPDRLPPRPLEMRKLFLLSPSSQSSSVLPSLSVGDCRHSQLCSVPIRSVFVGRLPAFYGVAARSIRVIPVSLRDKSLCTWHGSLIFLTFLRFAGLTSINSAGGLGSSNPCLITKKVRKGRHCFVA